MPDPLILHTRREPLRTEALERIVQELRLLVSERFKDEIEAALERAARPPQRGRPRKSGRLGTDSAEM